MISGAGMSRFDALYRAICTHSKADAILVRHNKTQPDFSEFSAKPLSVLYGAFTDLVMQSRGVGDSPEAALEDLARELGVDISGVSHA